MLASFIRWNVDPELVSLGPIHIRYYGLLFAIGFYVGYMMLEKMYKHEKLPLQWAEKVFVYIVIATVVGARLGHVIFYGWPYYSQHPAEILMVWKGGLASHGGALGILVALYIYSKKVTKKSMIWTLDRVVVPVAFVAVLIRLGNLMNSEIYGHETSLPWGFIFERNGETVPKHPTQIYEALSYLVVFFVLRYMYWKTEAKDKLGLIFGTFLIGIFGARFFIEYVKEVQEPWEINMIDKIGLDMGQLLSIPFVLFGTWLIWNALKKGGKIQKVVG
jgi:prolipoprotein diacylglyceryl transferase